MNYVKPETKHAKCAVRALTISIISLVSAVVCTVFLPFILSPIAIIMAHISKGRLKHKHIAGQAAIAIAVISLFLNCTIIGYSLYRYQTSSVVRDRVNTAFYQTTGMTIQQYEDELLKNTGISIDVLNK